MGVVAFSLACAGPFARHGTANEVVPASETVPVDTANLLVSERYWPYRVQLVEPLVRADTDQPIRARRVGVLIRVEPSGNPRIDFGTLGKYEVPVEKTDIVHRANRIRTGQVEKSGPNFVHAIRTRMLDSRGTMPMPMRVEETDPRPGFLCVFADPSDDAFPQIVASLAPLRDRHQVMTILFPQGQHPDLALHAELHELGWTVPYLPDALSEPYTRSLIDASASLPFVLLQTREGRLVLQKTWSPGDEKRIGSAIDSSFAEPLL
jgi:hypothetical protein